MLPGAAALVLAAAQSAACIEAPGAGTALAEQAELCLETLFADGDQAPLKTFFAMRPEAAVVP